jgi:acetyl esterase/lipase
VFYILHGGGYVGGVATLDHPIANITLGLLKNVVSVHRALSLEYRLSTTAPLTPSNPFPAALLDAIAGYNYLVNDLGFHPENIIIEGDSAGGHLALNLTRYLVENKNSSIPNLPSPPGSLLLLSPWCDIGTSHDVPRSTAWLQADFDLEPNGIDYAKAAFIGPHGVGFANTNPYMSPSSLNDSLIIHFHGFPRTMIVSGSAENLLPQIKVLRDRMVRDLGHDTGDSSSSQGKVRYVEIADCPHDFIVFPFMEPERTLALKEIANWLR